MKEYNSVLLRDEEADVLVDMGDFKGISFPGDFNIAVKNLSFRDNQYFWYDDTHVIGLYFIGSKLTNLPENIGNLSYLRFIEFNECSVQKFPTSFKKLHNLNHIGFINDAESTISLVNIDLPDIFQELKNLKSFEVDGIFNVFIPPSFIELKNLEELRLDYCLFSPNRANFMINHSAEEISDIVKIIHELPEDIGKLKSLRKISLYYSKIEELPESLINLTSLNELDLCCCEKLSNFKIVFSIKSLEKLKLKNCKLQFIPKTIANLRYLKELDLSWNNLKKIPLEISYCKKLEKLSISYNSFSESIEGWVKSLINLPKLSELIISDKFLNSIPKELLDKKDLKIKRL